MEVCNNCGRAYFGVKAWASPDYCSGECYEQAELDREYGLEWDSIRESIVERDEVCQDCEDDGSDKLMDVHHKTPLREFEDLDEAHADENLVLLCRSCHRTRHKEAENLS
jgi:5-methylcytosine-specific restriction endonuclease McrA